MLSDTYDYFEKEKEIKQETVTEFRKTVMPLYSSLFISAYIVHRFFFFFNQKNHWSLLVRCNLLGQDFHTKNQSLDSNRINSPTKFFVKNLPIIQRNVE